MGASENIISSTPKNSESTMTRMTPTGLLRTLFSVLALLVVVGLMTAQAQTVVVDEDDTQRADEITISDGLNTLNNQVTDGSGTLIVVAGDYRDTDALVDLGNGNIPNITDLTFRIERDDSDDTDQLTINTLDLSGGGANVTDVTLESDGNGFLRIRADDGSDVAIGGTPFDLALQEGTLTLDAAAVLSFQAPVNSAGTLNIYRTDGSDVTGEMPEYSGDISRLEYDADGDNITAGNELGAGTDVSRVSTLAIDDAGGTGNTHTVTFGVNLSVDVFAHNAADDVVFEDFTVDNPFTTGADVTVNGTLHGAGTVTVNAGHALTVDGTLEIEGQNVLVADGTINNSHSDVNNNGSPSNAGSLQWVDTIDRSALGGDLVDVGGSGGVVFNNVTLNVEATGAGATPTSNLVNDAGTAGIFEVGGTLAVNPVSDDNTDSDTVTEVLRQAEASTFVVNNVSVDNVADGSSDTDNTLVDILDAAQTPNATFRVGGELNVITVEDDGTVELVEGSQQNTLTGQLDNTGTGGGGTVTVSGDTEYRFRAAGDSPVDNSGSGTISISNGVTFRISAAGAPSQPVLNNNGSSVTGGGTLRVTGNNTYTITTLAGETQELPSVTADAALNIEDDAAGVTAITVDGTLTANSPVTFGTPVGTNTGNIEVSGDVVANASVDFGNGTDDTGTVTVGGTLTANADVTAGPGAQTGRVSVGNDLVANVGTVDFSNAAGGGTAANPDVVVGGMVDINMDPSGTVVDASGVFLTVEGDFVRAGDPNATFTTTGGTTLNFGGTGEVEFSPGSKFTINGNLRIAKGEGEARLVESVAVAGNVRVVPDASPSLPNNEFIIEENFFLSGGDTDFFINSTVDTPGDGFIVVDGPGPKTFQRTVSSAQIATLPTLPNLRTRSNGDANDVEIATDLEFDNTIELRNGGITIINNSDFSPTGPDALVKRHIDGANTVIAAAGGNTFNGDGELYNLTYTASAAAAADVGNEFTVDVRHLLVETNATPQLVEDETVNGDLTVETGAQISDDDADGSGTDNNARTVTLAGDDATHSIVGTVEGTNAGGGTAPDNSPDPITLDVTGENVAINGSTDDANDASTIEGLTASAAGLTVSDVQQVEGNVWVSDGASLTLGLSAADGNGVDGDASGADDQTVEGTITVNDNLTLASNVESVSATGTNDVHVDQSGSNGAIEFASYNLTLTGDGAQFNGNGDASYSSSGGGRLVFNNLSGGGTNQMFGVAGNSVPNVTISSAVTLFENAAVSNDLLVEATVTSGGNDLSFDNEATLDVATAFTGTGAFISTGSTLTLNQDASVSNFTVNSGSDGTTNAVQDDDAAQEDLTVGSQLTLQSGTLDHALNVWLTGNDGDEELVNVDGSVWATSGYIVFDAGGPGTNANAGANPNNFTLDLQADLTIPHLRVADDANFDDTDGESLTIGNDSGRELWLQEEFHQATNDGDLNITAGTTITRDTYIGNDVLDREPVFPSDGTYNLVFGAGNGASFNSGFEVDDDDDTINNVTVQTGAGGEIDFQNNVFGGTVAVNGMLDVQSGAVRFDGNNARQVVMNDGSTLRRWSVGVVLNQIAQAPEPATYTLIYTGGGSFNASANEFLNTGRVALVTSIDDNTTGGIILRALPGSRTVTSLTVNNGVADQTRLTDGNNTFTLTVSGASAVTGGILGAGFPNQGTLAAQGDLTIDGATVNTVVDIEGNTTVTNNGVVGGNFTTAGNFVFESGNLGGINLTFDGTGHQDFQLANSTVLNTLTLSQQASSTPQVNLTGASIGIGAQINLTHGLLVVADGQMVALGQRGAANGPFPGNTLPAAVNHNPDAGNLSHVVGTVQHGIAAGTPSAAFPQGRFEWPVGSMTEYRPAAITFTEDDPINTRTNIRINHVDENPQGTGGLARIMEVGNYASQYWLFNVTTGLSSSQEFDLELETGTAGFVDKFDQADQLRLIRRFDGDADENDWLLQGQSENYRNALFRRDSNGDGTLDKEFASVRTNSSTGGLVRQGTRFTIGLPSRAPVLTNYPQQTLTVLEDNTLTFDFQAHGRDLASDLSFALSNAPENSSISEVPGHDASLDAEQSGANGGFGAGSSPGSGSATFAVNTDDGSIASVDYTVTIDGLDASGFTDMSGTSSGDDDIRGLHVHNADRGDTGGIVFGILGDPSENATLDPTTSDDADLEMSVDNGTLTLTGTWDPDEATDPNSFADALMNTATGEDVPLYLNVHSSGNLGGEVRGQLNAQETARFTFTPDFDQQGTYTPAIEVTDQANGLTTTMEFSLEVEDNTPDFTLGDPSGDGECSVGDVANILAESIGKNDFSDLVPFDLAARLAADVSGDGTVNAGDASVVSQFIAGLRDSFPAGEPGCSRAGGSSTVAQVAAVDMSNVSGSVSWGDVKNGENGQTLLPIELEGDVQNVRSVQLTANFDQSSVRVEDVKGSLPEGWQLVQRIDETGTVQIAMAGAKAAPAGTIAELVLSLDGENASARFDGSALLNTSTQTQMDATSVSPIPGEFALEANRPNPVHTSTTIEYSLPEATDVTLEVYNVLGQRVTTLVNEKKSAGTFQVDFNASSLSSGVYIYRMEAGSFSETGRMTVVR